MRILSEYEEELCQRIVSGKINLPTLLDEDLDESCIISVDESTQEVWVKYELSKFMLSPQERGDKINEIVKTIIIAIKLLSLLQKENYITLYSQSEPVQSSYDFGPGPKNEEHIHHNLPDRDVVSDILKYYLKTILISQEFIRFCDNGFIARDEQRFRQQIERATTSAANSSISARNSARSAQNSTIALCVSTIALIISTTFNYYNYNQSHQPKSISIEQKQIDSLLSHLNLINRSIDSIKLHSLKSITTVTKPTINTKKGH